MSQIPLHPAAHEKGASMLGTSSYGDINELGGLEQEQEQAKHKVEEKIEPLTTPTQIKQEQIPPKSKKRKPLQWKPEDAELRISTPANFTKVNSHKAGFDTVDKEQVQKIIDSLTAGTPHYDRQKQKAKERHARMLAVKKKVDSALSQPERIEKRRYLVDHNDIPELEFRRSKGRVRVCCDADCYYSACEALDNPELRGKPHAVKMGDGPNSILATSSYEARKYGVRAGMPVFIGEALCPSLIIVLARMERYMQFSKMMESVFVKYDPQYMMGSLDETFLDITHLVSADRPAADVVNDLRRDVKEATGGLTVSAGCAPNLMIAKIAADMNKPDGQTILIPGADEDEIDFVKKFMSDLPLIKVPGIGPVTEGLLQGALDFKVVGDIYEHRAVVGEVFTPYRTRLFLRFALGIGCPWCDIYDYGREFIRKGIGANRTFGREECQEKLLTQLQRIAEILERDMETAGIVGGRTFTLRLKTAGFVSFGRSITLPAGAMVCTADDFVMFGTKIFMEHMPLTLRRIGMKLNKLTFRKRPKGSIKQYFKANDDLLDQDVVDEVEGNWKTSAQIEQARERAKRFFHEEWTRKIKTGSVKFKQAACVACAGDSGTISEHALKFSCPVCRKRCFKYISGLNKHMDTCLGSEHKKPAVDEAKKGTLTHFTKKQKPGILRQQSTARFSMKQDTVQVKNEKSRGVKKEKLRALTDISNGKSLPHVEHVTKMDESVKGNVQERKIKKEEVVLADEMAHGKVQIAESSVESSSQESILREFGPDGLPEFLGQVEETVRRTKRKKKESNTGGTSDIAFNSEDGLPMYLGQSMTEMVETKVEEEAIADKISDPTKIDSDDERTMKSPSRKRPKLTCPVCNMVQFENKRALCLHVDICVHAASQVNGCSEGRYLQEDEKT